jgi:predicted AAA+ superfamily ATPase
MYINRLIEGAIKRALGRGKSILLLGPRQTGKTTLVCRQPHQLHINFISPEIRQRYEKKPSLLAGEVEALYTSHTSRPTVILDEVQRVPEILDVVQDLIDRKIADFILTGSSARQLRRHGHANLLPGRVVCLRLDPLCLSEARPANLESCLFDGSLPGLLAVANSSDRETDLASYVTTYLEDEVRAEAMVRKLGPFARFLEYAAADAGRLLNAHKLSQEIGVSHPTIQSYFQILEDCLIIERIEPLNRTQTRKKLIRSQKYLFFDLGVRRLAAREGRDPPRETMGHLFEQYIGLELLRMARATHPQYRLRFWRDPDGPEVDWILETPQGLIPVEVKWTESPTVQTARHLHLFLKEYPQALTGFVVCRTPRIVQLSSRVSAIPWQELETIIPNF